MPRSFAQWATLLLGVATVFWLGYAVGRVQNIVDLSRLYRDVDTDRYTLTRAGVLVHFERLGGAGKPYVRSGDGLEVIELSDWDRNSRIVVDGTAYELVRLYPTSSADFERYRVVSTLHGDNWLLEREVTLEETGTVRIDHTFVARKPIRRVDLSLAHAHTFFVDVELSERAVTATTSRLTRDQMLAGLSAPAEYRVTAVSEGPGPRFRAGDAGTLGIASFIGDLSTDNPPQDQRVLLGRERFQVERIAS